MDISKKIVVGAVALGTAVGVITAPMTLKDYSPRDSDPVPEEQTAFQQAERIRLGIEGLVNAMKAKDVYPESLEEIPDKLRYATDLKAAYAGKFSGKIVDAGETAHSASFMKNPLNRFSLEFPNATSMANFYGYESVTSVVANSIQSLAYTSAFGYCSNLESASFPNLSTCTGDNSSSPYGCFAHCEKLKHVNMPNLETSGQDMFLYDSAIESLSFPKLKNANPYSFYGCTGLTLFSAPLLETIGNKAFYNDSKIVSLDFPVLGTIGDYAFYYCSKLSSFDAPALTSIGQYGFQGCTSLASFDAPALTSIGSYGFQGCTSLASFDADILGSIPSYCFDGITALSEVSIPSATTIGEYAFQGCSNIESMDCAPTTVGRNAFYNCTKLSSFDFSNLVDAGWISGSTLEYTFRNTAITDGNFPKLVRTGEYAFSDTKLVNVDAPLLTAPKRNCFGSIPTLESARFDSLVSAPISFLLNATSLTDVYMPNLESADAYTFKGCSAIEELDLPKLKTFSGIQVFMGCTNLRDLTLDSEHIQTLPGETFRDCKNLIVPSLPNLISVGTYEFAGIQEEQEIELPSLASTSQHMFEGSSFTRISLPECTQLQEYSFNNCSMLEVINIPNCTRVNNISIFYGCDSLIELTIPNLVRCNTEFGNNPIVSSCGRLEICKLGTEGAGIGYDWNYGQCGLVNNCQNITNVQVKLTKTSYNVGISYRMFESCPKLKYIKLIVNGGYTYYNGSSSLCYGKSSLEEVELIGVSFSNSSGAQFSNCPSLKKVTMASIASELKGNSYFPLGAPTTCRFICTGEAQKKEIVYENGEWVIKDIVEQ